MPQFYKTIQGKIKDKEQQQNMANYVRHYQLAHNHFVNFCYDFAKLNPEYNVRDWGITRSVTPEELEIINDILLEDGEKPQRNAKITIGEGPYAALELKNWFMNETPFPHSWYNFVCCQAWRSIKASTGRHEVDELESVSCSDDGDMPINKDKLYHISDINNHTLTLHFHDKHGVYFDEFDVDVIEDRLGVLSNIKTIFASADGNTVNISGKVSIDWAYEPVDSLGMDFNATLGYFIIFSEETSLNLNSRYHSKIKKLVVEKNRLWKERNELRFTGKASRSQMRNIYKRWNKVRNQIDGLTVLIAKEIIDYAKANKLLLCIDTAATGISFGNEHLISNLKAQCENKGIPHVLVPSDYTSRRCEKCENKSLENRTSMDNKKHDKFKCSNCPNEHPFADEHAACNIRDWGEYFFSTGDALWLPKYKNGKAHLKHNKECGNFIKGFQFP